MSLSEHPHRHESLAEVDAILFDLGGVLYSIDPAGFQAALRQLARRYGSSERVQSDHDFRTLNHQLERGEIDPESFLRSLAERHFPGASTEELRQVWNRMLAGLYPDRHALIQHLAQSHRLFLLSNTNVLHHNHFQPQLKSIEPYFERIFYSFELGFRKPEPEIFEHVLQDATLSPERTLFVDDSLTNVDAARSLGLRTRLVERPDELHTYFR